MSWVTQIKTWRVEGSTAIATRYTDESVREVEEVARVEFATEAQAREFVDNLIATEGHANHRWHPEQSLLGRATWLMSNPTPELLAQYRRQYDNERSGSFPILRIHPDVVESAAAEKKEALA